jgi:hypothetical protein
VFPDLARPLLSVDFVGSLRIAELGKQINYQGALNSSAALMLARFTLIHRVFKMLSMAAYAFASALNSVEQQVFTLPMLRG